MRMEGNMQEVGSAGLNLVTLKEYLMHTFTHTLTRSLLNLDQDRKLHSFPAA